MACDPTDRLVVSSEQNDYLIDDIPISFKCAIWKVQSGSGNNLVDCVDQGFVITVERYLVGWFFVVEFEDSDEEDKDRNIPKASALWEVIGVPCACPLHVGCGSVIQYSTSNSILLFLLQDEPIVVLALKKKTLPSTQIQTI